MRATIYNSPLLQLPPNTFPDLQRLLYSVLTYALQWFVFIFLSNFLIINFMIKTVGNITNLYGCWNWAFQYFHTSSSLSSLRYVCSIFYVNNFYLHDHNSTNTFHWSSLTIFFSHAIFTNRYITHLLIVLPNGQTYYQMFIISIMFLETLSSISVFLFLVQGNLGYMIVWGKFFLYKPKNTFLLFYIIES